MSLTSRLARVQEQLRDRGIGQAPPVMRGALEMHCPGGLSHVEGQVCSEHEDCVFQSTPMMAPIRRQIIIAWHEGMKNLDIG